MNEKFIIIMVVLFGIALVNVRVSYLINEKMVEEMEKVCFEEYDGRHFARIYEYHFYCANFSWYPNKTDFNLDMVRIQWSDAWARPFEPPNYENLTMLLNSSKN